MLPIIRPRKLLGASKPRSKREVRACALVGPVIYNKNTMARDAATGHAESWKW